MLNRDGIESIDIEKLLELYKKHGSALFPQLDRDMLIDYMTDAGIYNGFIDYDSAECDFNNEEFIGLLEFLREYDNVPLDGYEPARGGSVPQEHQQLVKGHEAMFYVSDVEWYEFMLAAYAYLYEDTGYSITGFPTTDGSGVVINPRDELAVTKACAYPEGVMEFINLVFDSDEAAEYLWPIEMHSNREIFLKRFEYCYSEENTAIFDYGRNSVNVFEMDKYGDEYISKKLEESNSHKVDIKREEIEYFIRSVLDADVASPVDDEVLRILNDELIPYLAGTDSAENTARRIDSRVGIYLAERYG